MSATVQAKSKAKPRSAPKTKEERAEINRQNSKKSTGPSSDEGKRNSKYNAVTHGLMARTVLLPGEDPAALAVRQQHLVDSFQPRNAVERDEEQARGRLTAIIDQEVCRLRHVRETLQAIADVDAAEAPGRLAFETGPEGDRYRRYGHAAERLVIKRFGDFLKTRGMTMEGGFDAADVEVETLPGIGAPMSRMLRHGRI